MHVIPLRMFYGNAHTNQSNKNPLCPKGQTVTCPAASRDVVCFPSVRFFSSFWELVAAPLSLADWLQVVKGADLA